MTTQDEIVVIGLLLSFADDKDEIVLLVIIAQSKKSSVQVSSKEQVR